MPEHYFLNMIDRLRQHEEIVLYWNILATDEWEEKEVTAFLKNEYSRETLTYPFTAPDFNEEAALWAAKIVYIAAQLILYRKNDEAELPTLLPDFTGEGNASAILSADLCLRFLPDMMIQLKALDKDDKLITHLEALLIQWHYSGVRYNGLNVDELNFAAIKSDPCLQQLYTNRIIENKKTKLALLDDCRQMIAANMGDHIDSYWPELKTEMNIHE